jgi:glycosyltransferase involved in cell wall biosynthesis
MMHRLPIVATRIGAVPDMVQPGVTGELVNPGDSDGLAIALIALLGDPLRCQLYGAAGYERATQVYTWNRVGERMRERILQVIGRPTLAVRRG